MSVASRFEFLDSLRGIAVMLMILQHFALVLMDLSLVDSVPYILMVVLGMFSATMFLMLVGACLFISVERRREQGETESGIKGHVLKRGFIIMVSGFLFMLLWEREILSYIGIFIMMTYSMLFLGVGSRLIIGIVILALSSFLKFFPFLNWGEFPGLQFFQTSWHSSEFINRMYGDCSSISFQWVSIVIFGSVLGSLLVQFLREGRGQAFRSMLLRSGLILAGVGALELFFMIPVDDFPALYAMLTIGLTLMVLSGLIWLEESEKSASRVLKALAIYGRLSLSIYVGHIIIWLGALRLLGLALSLSLLEVLAALLSCYVFTLAFGVLWLKIKRAGPLELVIARLTDH